MIRKQCIGKCGSRIGNYSTREMVWYAHNTQTKQQKRMSIARSTHIHSRIRSQHHTLYTHTYTQTQTYHQHANIHESDGKHEGVNIRNFLNVTGLLCVLYGCCCCCSLCVFFFSVFCSLFAAHCTEVNIPFCPFFLFLFPTPAIQLCVRACILYSFIHDRGTETRRATERERQRKRAKKTKLSLRIKRKHQAKQNSACYVAFIDFRESSKAYTLNARIEK